jgi:methionyl-tRNA formyltransferase
VRIVILADGFVGEAICNYLMGKYPVDIGLVVTTCENKIQRRAYQSGFSNKIFSSSEQLAEELNQEFDLGVLAWWPKIIREPLLSKPKRGFVNTHPSLLPFNRGKHFNFWAIVEQAPFGVTLHKVDEGTDSGDILAQQEISYDWTDNGESLYLKAQNSMIELFQQTYPALRANTIQPIQQEPNAGSLHHSSELDAASHINLNQNYRAKDMLNLLRARTFKGYPACWFEVDGIRYEVTVQIRKVKP